MKYEERLLQVRTSISDTARADDERRIDVEVNVMLIERGLLMTQGTLVDATLLELAGKRIDFLKTAHVARLRHHKSGAVRASHPVSFADRR